MKIICYGTLKRDYGNNYLLRNSKYVKDIPVKGYKLVYSYREGSFPVAVKSEGDTLVGELWDISGEHQEETLSQLDWLEGVPSMYTRDVVLSDEEQDTWMYVGNPNCFRDSNKECPKDGQGSYVWYR